MSKTILNVRISNFRNLVVAWLLLTMFSLSFTPSVSLAQQPTATIKTLSGDVLTSGQVATVGTIVQAGDTIQTQAGASVVLELSNGSEIHWQLERKEGQQYAHDLGQQQTSPYC